MAWLLPLSLVFPQHESAEFVLLHFNELLVGLRNKFSQRRLASRRYTRCGRCFRLRTLCGRARCRPLQSATRACPQPASSPPFVSTSGLPRRESLSKVLFPSSDVPDGQAEPRTPFVPDRPRCNRDAL